MNGPDAGTFRSHNVTHRLCVVTAWAILLVGLGLMGFYPVGWRFIPTRGDSMEPTSSSGSLLIARLAAPEDIRVGDFIVFPEASQTLPFTAHRVAALLSEGGRFIALTKGDNNMGLDPERVTLDNPLPRVVLAVPWVGWFVTLKTVCFLLAIIALLGLRIASPWVAQRRVTMVHTSDLRWDRCTKWLAENKISIRMTRSLKMVMSQHGV